MASRLLQHVLHREITESDCRAVRVTGLVTGAVFAARGGIAARIEAGNGMAARMQHPAPLIRGKTRRADGARLQLDAVIRRFLERAQAWRLAAFLRQDPGHLASAEIL